MMKTKNQESGRSMVEMLGVLAIIGVLSVGGIAGFKIAMKKHQANDLLNELNIRANSVAMQLTADPNRTPNILEFGQGFSGCDDCQFSYQNVPSSEQFMLKVTGVSKEICETVSNMVGANNIIREISTCPTSGLGEITFLFNKDLSSEDKQKIVNCNDRGIVINGSCSCYKGFTGTDCSTGAGEATCGSQNTGSRYEDSDGNVGCLCKKGYSGYLCETHTEACNGHGYFFGDEDLAYEWNTCICDDGFTGADCNQKNNLCHQNNDCKDKNGNIDTSKYCAINDGDMPYGKCSEQGSGVCKDKGILKTASHKVVYNHLDFYKYETKLNWRAAKNLCLAHGLEMIKLSDLGLTTSYQTTTTDTSLSDAGLGGSYWTQQLEGDAFCGVYYVQATYYGQGVGTYGSGRATYWTLCVDK